MRHLFSHEISHANYGSLLDFPQLHSASSQQNSLLQNFIRKIKGTDYDAYRCGKSEKVCEAWLFSSRSKLRRSPITHGRLPPISQRPLFAKPFPFNKKRVKVRQRQKP